jgi:hypothetical protein
MTQDRGQAVANTVTNLPVAMKLVNYFRSSGQSSIILVEITFLYNDGVRQYYCA